MTTPACKKLIDSVWNAIKRIVDKDTDVFDLSTLIDSEIRTIIEETGHNMETPEQTLFFILSKLTTMNKIVRISGDIYQLIGVQPDKECVQVEEEREEEREEEGEEEREEEGEEEEEEEEEKVISLDEYLILEKNKLNYRENLLNLKEKELNAKEKMLSYRRTRLLMREKQLNQT